jgi:ribosomal protein L37AE/L43A
VPSSERDTAQAAPDRAIKTEEQAMNKNLTLMVANLFVKSKGGEELPSKMQRLRDEIKKSTQGEDSVFGKFHGLLESFREIIPEEKQRYHAAIKALSTTAKLSQKEVVKAIGNQFEELKSLEKELLASLPAWRDEMKTLEARAKQIKSEITKLREKITQLENEAKGIQGSMAEREKETELIEQSIKELVSNIGTEVAQIKNKVEEHTAEPAPPPPAPPKPVVKSSAPPAEKKSVVEQKVEIERPPAQKDTEWQKTCPNCGGRLNFHTIDKMWMCYSCAYEEPGEGHEQEKSEAINAPSSGPSSAASFAPSRTPFSAPSSTPAPPPAPVENQPSSKTKTCPVCSKTMYWYPNEKAWRCPSCQYERSI